MEPRDAPVPERVAGARQGRRSATTTLALIAALIGVAIIKPWGGVGVGPDAFADPASTRPPARGTPRPTATPGPARLAADRLAKVCLNPSGWRIAATERWGDQSIRSWRAVEPSKAWDPRASAISFAPVAAEALPLLGYCAPISGPDRPPDDARGSILTVRADGAAADLGEVRAVRFAP